MDDFACPRGWMDQVESWKDGEKTPVLPGDFSAVTNNFSTMGGHQHLLSPGSLKKKTSHKSRRRVVRRPGNPWFSYKPSIH